MRIRETDKAWVAAIVDFQGHLIRKKNKQRAEYSEQIVLSVETRYEEIVNRLSAMTGTQVLMHEQHKLKPELMRRGCAEHCPTQHVHVNPFYSMPVIGQWTVTGASAAIVLWNIRRYLQTSREPWEWALSQVLSQLRLTGPGSGGIKGSAQRLHALGWELPPVMQQLLPKELEKAG